MSKTFTAKEVGEHKDEKNGLYIIVDSGVYDVTSQYRTSPSPPLNLTPGFEFPVADIVFYYCTADFLEEHPGGAKILKRVAGKNATKQFWKYHGKNVLEKYGGKLKVGELAETAKL
ncbi:hypothetical protein NPX13_g9204 [Xylaria arbuscula]|uniref:Cytochrome b5 heme-binding domain-containing protein n=1 Tax=Xylaria arbuscula TaxID=114810 RepID=A0A9W8N763_9PEZI|nr:hypothetical protein NPX13_g9204 [Xylaria arbuscula]